MTISVMKMHNVHWIHESEWKLSTLSESSDWLPGDPYHHPTCENTNSDTPYQYLSSPSSGRQILMLCAVLDSISIPLFTKRVCVSYGVQITYLKLRLNAMARTLSKPFGSCSAKAMSKINTPPTKYKHVERHLENTVCNFWWLFISMNSAICFVPTYNCAVTKNIKFCNINHQS